MENFVEFAGYKGPPEVLISVVGLVVALFAGLASLVIKKRQLSVEESIKRDSIDSLLSKPEFLDALNGKNEAAKYIVDYLKSRDEANDRRGAFTSIMESITARIEWDVAGLIGVMVTVVIMIMVIARAVDGIPKEVFAGWLTIIGFYFGRASRNDSIESGPKKKTT